MKPEIETILSDRQANGELPCKKAFEVAGEMNLDPAEVGMEMDRLRIKIVGCQLGLFGYTPEKRIVTDQDPKRPALTAAIERSAANGRIPCKTLWQIADRLSIPRLIAGNACEYLKIKVKQCQLGAFD